LGFDFRKEVKEGGEKEGRVLTGRGGKQGVSGRLHGGLKESCQAIRIRTRKSLCGGD